MEALLQLFVDFYTFYALVPMVFSFSVLYSLNLSLSCFWQELIPCTPLSFEYERILMWRGNDWKTMYPEGFSASMPVTLDATCGLDGLGMYLSRDWSNQITLWVLSSLSMGNWVLLKLFPAECLWSCYDWYHHTWLD